MYIHSEEHSVEGVCYEKIHIDKIKELITNKFEKYFNKFIETENGKVATIENIKEVADELGIKVTGERKVNTYEKFNRIIVEAIEFFEKDREKYKKIMDEEALEEYKEDTEYFKNQVLRNECPIIHFTLQNKNAKALDQYRADFRASSSKDLLRVVTNLNNFSKEYVNIYNQIKDAEILNYEELGLDVIDTEEYTAYGVIGGGIKSHFLYKTNPEMFSNRTREAIWALWYLTDKQPLDCEMDSEFLMIDVKKVITQQNYFYPYSLFSYYALTIYNLLHKKAIEHGVEIPIEYRYVLVDSFLSFVANEHREEILLFGNNIKEGNI